MMVTQKTLEQELGEDTLTRIARLEGEEIFSSMTDADFDAGFDACIETEEMEVLSLADSVKILDQEGLLVTANIVAFHVRHCLCSVSEKAQHIWDSRCVVDRDLRLVS